MNSFWTGWVLFLLVLNLGIAFFLFVWGQRIDIPTQPDGTTGHVWAHGVLREAVRQLPTWWVVFSAGLFVWGVVIPGPVPGVRRTPGSVALDLRRQVRTRARVERCETRRNVRAHARRSRRTARERSAGAVRLAVWSSRTIARPVTVAMRAAMAAVGAPNLVDGNSLYGNEGDTILASILDGRKGVMPALGNVVGEQGVNEVVAYVLTLNGYGAPPDWVAAGKPRFEAVCTACHGADGRGNQAIGAPDLTDDVWLYGRDFARMAETVRNGRNGIMPAWRERIGEDRSRAVAAWIYAGGQREIGIKR